MGTRPGVQWLKPELWTVGLGKEASCLELPMTEPKKGVESEG